ncbi:MAG TPA: pilus assembly protein N-terminal domain-containing protein [Pyrinomonadaceae bacterium]
MNRLLRQFRRGVLLLALCAAAASAAAVSADVSPSVLAALARRLSPTEEPERVGVQTGHSREIAFDAPVSAAVVTDAGVASAAVVGARLVRVTGVSTGNTVLIVTTETARVIYAVEVTAPARRSLPRAAGVARRPAPTSEGAYGLTLARQAGASGLAHVFDYRRQLGSGRVLRAEGSFINGGGAQFGAGRLALALESDKASLELFDTHIFAGRMSGGVSGLRGAHYQASPSSSLGGLDLFAGYVPSSQGREKSVGALVPVVRSRSLMLRAGALWGATASGLSEGLRAAADLRYTPDARTTLAAEFSGGPGRASWGARLDAPRDRYGFAAEARQGGGAHPARTYAASAFWKPAASLGASARWHLSDASAGRGASSSLAASINYSLGEQSKLGFTLGRFRADGAALAGTPGRSGGEYAAATFRHVQGGWSNTLEAGYGRTAAPGGGERAAGQAYITEQLRRQFGAWAVVGSYKYSSGGGAAGQGVSNQEMGATLRAAFSRYRLEGGAYYRIFGPGGTRADGAGASAAVSYRLDALTQIRFAAGRDFAPGSSAGSTGLTLSFSRRFGVGGFNPFRFLRRGGGRVSGLVYLDHNGNGVRDSGEEGAANMLVNLDGGARSVLTGADGGFAFKAGDGDHAVELRSDRLGVSLLASTATARTFRLGDGESPFISFGVTDGAALVGRVYNDVGAGDAETSPGVAGVLLRLTGAGQVAESLTTAGGRYSFSNLRPGSYSLEVVADSLPANFRPPAVLAWPVALAPIARERINVGLVAERAIIGVVFVDRDGDAAYSPGVDSPLEGVSVEFRGRVVRSDKAGAYMLRDLPAGVGTLAATRGGVLVFSKQLAFDAAPATLTALVTVPAENK